VKRYLVTTAVNNTNVHPGFWSSVKQWEKFNHGEVRVVAARYKNPTSKNENKKVKAEDWYAEQVMPYLTRKDEKLGPNLTLFASMPIQPTSSNPTSRLEVLAAESSVIIGHVKRQMQVIPTDKRAPRVIWSTGACTLAKYSKSRAGQAAKQHHVIGAVVVEVVGRKFFVRNVTAARDGSFTDLDTTYAPTGVYDAERAISVTAGDIHVGQEDEEALTALESLVECVNPKHVVLHDVLDFDARSHHRQTPEERWDRRFDTVEAEMDANAAFFKRVVGWPGDFEIDVVESNHHEHLTRWMREFDEEKDVLNAPFWAQLKADMYKARKKSGQWPNLYELEMRARGIEPGIRFLTREGTLKLAKVEHAFHGDKGVNGARGSARAYAKLGVKCTIGHSHTPCILDGVFQTGVTGKLDMDYNTRPSTWLHAHVVLHADGKRQLIITIGEAFRG
jgi:hypothetical protein